jgi:hypothetical protein
MRCTERSFSVEGALIRIEGIVGVDQRRSKIRVTEPLLDRTHRSASGGHLSSEGVAKIVEPDRPNLCSMDAGNEALAKLGRVEHGSKFRVCEDEIGRLNDRAPFSV